MILACSALKARYRRRLRRDEETLIVHLACSRDELVRRLSSRKNHFFDPALLDSQFAALDPPAPGDGTVLIDGDAAPEEVADDLVRLITTPAQRAARAAADPALPGGGRTVVVRGANDFRPALPPGPLRCPRCCPPVEAPAVNPPANPRAATSGLTTNEPTVRAILRDVPEPAVARPPAKTAWVCGGLSAALLWACFYPLGLGPLAWVALAPLCLLVRSPVRTRWEVRALWACGFVGTACQIQWMRLGDPAMYPAWIALSMYLGLYFPAFVLASRGLVHRAGVPFAVAVPVVWCGLELVRGAADDGLRLEPAGALAGGLDDAYSSRGPRRGVPRLAGRGVGERGGRAVRPRGQSG